MPKLTKLEVITLSVILDSKLRELKLKIAATDNNKKKFNYAREMGQVREIKAKLTGIPEHLRVPENW